MEKPEVFLRIKIDENAVPNEKGYFLAFLNTNKTSEKEPDYKSKGVGVWLNERKPKEEQEPRLQEPQAYRPRQEMPREGFRPKVVSARTL